MSPRKFVARGADPGATLGKRFVPVRRGFHSTVHKTLRLLRTPTLRQPYIPLQACFRLFLTDHFEETHPKQVIALHCTVSISLHRVRKCSLSNSLPGHSSESVTRLCLDVAAPPRALCGRALDLDHNPGWMSSEPPKADSATLKAIATPNYIGHDDGGHDHFECLIESVYLSVTKPPARTGLSKLERTPTQLQRNGDIHPKDIQAQKDCRNGKSPEPTMPNLVILVHRPNDHGAVYSVEDFARQKVQHAVQSYLVARLHILRCHEVLSTFLRRRSNLVPLHQTFRDAAAIVKSTETNSIRECTYPKEYYECAH